MKVLILACLVAAASATTKKYDSDGFYPDDVWNPLPENYEAMKATEKQEQLWSEIMKTDYTAHGRDLPGWKGQGFGALLKNLKSIFNLKPVFTHFSDVMVAGRVKAIHTYGVVAPFTFTPVNNTKYTGLFAEECSGLVRMSYAADPSKGTILPGLAWKFLIDSAPSVNVVSNFDLDGQGKNTAFFMNVFRSWLPNPHSFALRVLAYWFGVTEKQPGELPVSELAMKRVDGSDVSNAMSPTILTFKATSAIQNSVPSDSTNDFRDDLAKLPTGAFVDVYAAATLAEAANPTELIGHIKLDKQPIASLFGDARLFYRHQSKFDRT